MAAPIKLPVRPGVPGERQKLRAAGRPPGRKAMPIVEQRTMVEYLIRGMSDREIGDRLGYAAGTIRNRRRALGISIKLLENGERKVSVPLETQHALGARWEGTPTTTDVLARAEGLKPSGGLQEPIVDRSGPAQESPSTPFRSPEPGEAGETLFHPRRTAERKLKNADMCMDWLSHAAIEQIPVTQGSVSSVKELMAAYERRNPPKVKGELALAMDMLQRCTDAERERADKLGLWREPEPDGDEPDDDGEI